MCTSTHHVLLSQHSLCTGTLLCHHTVPHTLVHLVSKSNTISYVGCVVQIYVFLAWASLRPGFLQQWPMTDMLLYAIHSTLGSKWAILCVFFWQPALPFVVSSVLLSTQSLQWICPIVVQMRSTTSFMKFLLCWSWPVQIHSLTTKWTLPWISSFSRSHYPSSWPHLFKSLWLF